MTLVTSKFILVKPERNTMSSKFLITGATGSIGRNVVEFLLESGHKVRAFVHKNNEQSSQLQQLGAEIAVGDLDFMTIRPALLSGSILTSREQYDPRILLELPPNTE
jgi:NAD(P)-dependent dehydrogenase (short-subunit alcohol dehydrogenase family)